MKGMLDGVLFSGIFMEFWTIGEMTKFELDYSVALVEDIQSRFEGNRCVEDYIAEVMP
jgi:hypothetical protein